MFRKQRECLFPNVAKETKHVTFAITQWDERGKQGGRKGGDDCQAEDGKKGTAQWSCQGQRWSKPIISKHSMTLEYVFHG